MIGGGIFNSYACFFLGLHRLSVLLLVLGPLFSSQAQAQFGRDAATLALFHFDNPSGKVVKNETGDSKLDGELKGEAKIVLGAGKFGGGLVLDGDGDYMRVGNFGNPQEGTVELWFKVPNVKPSQKSDAPGVVWNLTDMGKEYGQKFSSPAYLGTHTGIAPPNLWFGIWTGKWEVADSGVDAKTLVGDWHHVAGSWGKRGIEIFIDGKLKGSNKNYTGALPDPAYTAWHLGSGSWRADMEGVIDGVRLSNKQRPADELLLTLAVAPKNKLAITWSQIKGVNK